MKLPWNRVAAAAVLLGVLLASWMLRLDQAALTQVDAGWKRALATFAAARALNAVISVAQGTEMALQPGGLGVTLAPGQVLDPINDLIEQFSTLMLFAAAAFGAQRVLVSASAWWPVSLLVSAVALAWAWQMWRQGHAQPWLSRLLLGLVLLRFLTPAVVLGSEAAFRLFLSKEYQTAQQTLERSTDELGQLGAAPAGPAGDSTLGDKLRRWASPGVELGQRLEALKATANQAVEDVVRLIVIFLLQTLVLPLLLGWLLLRGARALVPR